MQYTVITENDVSQWEDRTGVSYHFPKRYKDYLLPGTQVVYYKGKLKEASYRDSRLSDDPHYFGVATIVEKAYLDPDSDKGDLFVVLHNFTPFEVAVSFKDPETGEYLETIPENLASNYWRNGVRPIDLDAFERIKAGAGLGAITSLPTLGGEFSFTSMGQEGAKKQVFSTRYERDPKLRAEALKHHGTTCLACGFDFAKFYGEHGAGFIHVHHTTPLATLGGETTVSPKTDLIPLCANCHSMVHRKANYTLSLQELKQHIASAKSG
jgi:predicted HNH restriction endonuclease